MGFYFAIKKNSNNFIYKYEVHLATSGFYQKTNGGTDYDL